MSSFNIDYAMKAILWEDAKGKLRALVSVQGSYSSIDRLSSERFAALGDAVDAFISAVEGDGLQE